MEIHTCFVCLHAHPAYKLARRTLKDTEYNLGELMDLGLKIKDIKWYPDSHHLRMHRREVHKMGDSDAQV